MGIKISIVFWVVLFTNQVYADVYQYFDKDGTIIITDRPRDSKALKSLPAVMPRDIMVNIDETEGVYYDYYPVTGKNFEELALAANTKGPFDEDEKKNYPAMTQWNLGWSYKFTCTYQIDRDSIYAGLDISEVKFMSNIIVILPALSDAVEMSSDDLMLWKHFVQRLLMHEHDHVMIIKDPAYTKWALRAMAEVKEVVIPYGPQSDINAAIKAAVEAETGRIGHDLIRTIKLRNDDYDMLTDHGLKHEMREIFFGGVSNPSAKGVSDP